MNKIILITKLTLAMTCSLSMIGCQSGGLTDKTGQLSFQFQVPSAAPVQFQVQMIPAETEFFTVEVSGDGLTNSRTIRIALDANAGTQSHTMTELPTGMKTVVVKAFKSDTLLAQASTEVAIIAGETARAELDLQPVAQEPETTIEDGSTVLQISPALPLAMQVQLQISGEGLDSPVRKEIDLSANQEKAALGILPIGAKQARVVFSTEISGSAISSAPETVSFDVPAEGQAILALSAAELLEAYQQELDKLLDGLSPLELVALLGQVSPERLTKLFAGLPADVQERLRKNPTLSQFINFAEPVPAPTAQPTTVPTPQPTAKPVNTSGLLMDVRFAMVSQPAANLVLARPAKIDVSELGNIKVLNAGEPNTLFRASAWGLFVRTHYTGPQQVNCVVKFKHNATGKEIYAKEMQLGTKFTVNEKGFTGGVILFNEGQPIVLEPGAYTLQVQVTDPESNKPELAEYPLNFLPSLG